MERTVEITRATPDMHGVIRSTLARAFQDDPVLAWVMPDADRRRARLPGFFALFADLYVPLGETHVADDGAGAALWAPPGTTAVPEEAAEQFGDRLARLLQEDAERGMAVSALLDEHHPEAPCFYLQWMGVVPGRRGEGIGSELLHAVLHRCDSEGTAAYLEATSPDNRRLYERHGFAVTTELAIPGGPSLWPMWRDAQSTTA